MPVVVDAEDQQPMLVETAARVDACAMLKPLASKGSLILGGERGP